MNACSCAVRRFTFSEGSKSMASPLSFANHCEPVRRGRGPAPSRPGKSGPRPGRAHPVCGPVPIREGTEERSRPEQCEALVRVEDVGFDVVDDLGPPAERRHGAAKADPIQEFLLSGIL